MNDKTRQLDAAFDHWWHNEGSAPPSNIMDCEEHCRHVARIAWHNGAYVAGPDAEIIAWAVMKGDELLSVRRFEPVASGEAQGVEFVPLVRRFKGAA